MELYWTNTIFTLIAVAIAILVLCGLILVIMYLIKSQKRKARIEEKLDSLLEETMRDKK